MSSIADAVVAAVQAAVPGREVWDGIVPNSPDMARGYVCVYCPEGDMQLENLVAAVDGRLVKAYLNSFGPTRQAAGWLSRHATEYLQANGVTVAGWGHGSVSEHYSHAPSSDEDVATYPLVMIADEVHLLFAKE